MASGIFWLFDHWRARDARQRPPEGPRLRWAMQPAGCQFPSPRAARRPSLSG